MEKTPSVILEAGRADRQYWHDLWRYRELFVFLAWRDLSVRYKQTAVGVAWALVRPFITMVVFSLFGKLTNMETGGVPLPIMTFAAILPWTLFSSALSESAGSLLGNANLISKVYFPRLILPATSLMVCLVDFLISLAFLGVLMAWFQFWPTWRLLTLPLFTLSALLSSVAVGLWMASLTVKYRDFRVVVPFIIQFGTFVSPIAFLSSIIPEKWRLLYSLNPMVGVIDGFRWAVLGQSVEFYWPGLIVSIGLSIGLLWTGIWYFRRTEKTFADVI